jgi:hypothetical protein
MHIRASLPPSKRVELFLHEAMHFLVEGISFPSEAAEEMVVDMLGNRLVSFLRDNPDCITSVVTFLKEENRWHKK